MRILLSINFLLACIAVICASSSGEITMQNRVCKTSGCIDAARRILKNLDKSVAPCDNFYQFACGNYTSSQKNLLGNLATETDAKLNMQLKDSIDKEIDENDCRTLQLLKSHYFTCLDDENVKRTSTELLLDILSQLGGWPVVIGKSWNESAFHWTSLIYQLRRIGYKNSMNSFLSFNVKVDDMNNTNHIVSLDLPFTGLRLQLIEILENKIVQAYYEYMVDIATALGADKRYAEKELTRVLHFAKELAKIPSSPILYKVELSELESKVPEIPWKEYINQLLWPHYIVKSTEHIYIRKNLLESLEIISKTPKRVLANYALWQVIEESIPLMSEKFQEIKANFHSRISGTKTQPPRWQKCIKHLRDNMPLAIGALYVRKIFDTDLKKEGEELVNYIHRSFKYSLEKVEWMDKKTKRGALKKLKSLHSHVAYPDELLNDEIIDQYFENFKLIPDNSLDSYLSAGLFEMDKAYQQLRKIYNKTTWLTHGLHSATGNIHYNPLENSFTIPAASFQEELFAINRPNYLNYGSMGYLIGHEMTHALEGQGSRYDEQGHLANWWDPKTGKEYRKRTKCLVQQYNNYTVEQFGIHLNDKESLSENNADNGGVKQAYLAYEEYEKRNGAEPRLPGLSYSPRQLFWLNSANLYCGKFPTEALKYLITIDNHPIGEFRVIGALSNMPEFARDFECPLGTPMNPIKKCTLW